MRNMMGPHTPVNQEGEVKRNLCKEHGGKRTVLFNKKVTGTERKGKFIMSWKSEKPLFGNIGIQGIRKM